MDEIIISSKITSDLKKIESFADFSSFSRIINKITDYAEILTEGKLSGIINYNFQMNSSQTNMIIDLLADLQALSRVYRIAQKGTRDLEEEYVSNIFSDVSNPQNISSYISMRNILENRLSHQVQQYNMNMNKGNTTMSMSVNELHGHVKTHKDLSQSNVTISHKAQHGFIAASLHDAYVTILSRHDWWDDRSYMKFFFNEDDPSKRELNLITRDPRQSLQSIDRNVKKVLSYLEEINLEKSRAKTQAFQDNGQPEEEKPGSGDMTSGFSDRLMMTPFGRQYGGKIDTILTEIFEGRGITGAAGMDDGKVREMVSSLYQVYSTMPGSMALQGTRDALLETVYYLLSADFGLKTFAERFFYDDRRIPFPRYFSENKDRIEDFLTHMFMVFFEETFSSLFRIIRSLDMKQYACAFIIKRIYLTRGEEIPTFGYFLIKSIARYGKIKVL